MQSPKTNGSTWQADRRREGERRTSSLSARRDGIVQLVAQEMRAGDVVAILSNGGFDGIYEKLPQRLKALSGAAKA